MARPGPGTAGAGDPRPHRRLRRGGTAIPPGRQPWQRGKRPCRHSPTAFTEPASRSTACRFSWLFRDVNPSLPLAGALSARAFQALAARTIRTVGGDAANFGARQARRLRHDAWGSRPGEPPGPPARRLGLIPAGAPRHGGPLGARMADGVAPLGAGSERLPPAPRMATCAAHGWVRLTDEDVVPHVRPAGWRGPGRPQRSNGGVSGRRRRTSQTRRRTGTWNTRPGCGRPGRLVRTRPAARAGKSPAHGAPALTGLAAGHRLPPTTPFRG